MHLPDGLISGTLNVSAGMVAAAAVGVSAWRASREVEARPQVMPLLATTGAFVFAAQMLNFPIGGGTSGHFLGATVVAALLGPWSACLVLALVLVIQCLGFADGGLTALGANIMNLAVVGGMGSYLIMRGLRAVLPSGRAGFIAAVALSSWVGIVGAATACALELAYSGTSPFGYILPAMAGTHAVIGIGEALITTAVLSAVIATRPDLLPPWARIEAQEAHGAPVKRAWTLAGAGLITAFGLALFVSPFASVAPDGLEKVTENSVVSVSSERDEDAQRRSSAPLADYAVPGVGAEGVSTSLAGLIGTAVVFALGFGMIKLVTLRRKEQEN